jgi:hypothetical protein
MLEALSHLISWTGSGALETSSKSIGNIRHAPVDEDILVNDDTKAYRRWLIRIWNK